jgi:hypothetical protein
MSSLLGLLFVFHLFLLPAPQLHPIIYRPVTLALVISFLSWDTTDLHPYQDGIVDNNGVLIQAPYNCGDFSANLVKSARQQGIDAQMVGILFKHAVGHAIVAFKTTDAGIIYVEPQSDNIYTNVMVGSLLCTHDQNLCMGDGELIREIINHD